MITSSAYSCVVLLRDLLILEVPACTIHIQAEAVCKLFGGKKAYETLLTKEVCTEQIDMGDFYCVS